MSLHSEVDISGAIDTAERTEAGGDPIIRKLKIALPGSKGKYGGTKKEAPTHSARPRALQDACRKCPQSTLRRGTDE
jgi:hypothetical protein